MTVHEGERLFINRMVRREFGKSVDELLEEISEFHAKEEQLIINMYQTLHVDVQTIANILHVSAEYGQEVLSTKEIA